MSDRPCKTAHPELIPERCQLCYRAVHCREWQQEWGLPLTAGPCYDPNVPSPLPAVATADLGPGRPAGGPGTELRKVLAEFGIAEPPGCGCAGKAAQMDAWGPDGCRAQRAEIVAWLQENWRKLDRLTRAKAAVRALARRFLHPFNPAGALVDLAIARAESAAESPPGC